MSQNIIQDSPEEEEKTIFTVQNPARVREVASQMISTTEKSYKIKLFYLNNRVTVETSKSEPFRDLVEKVSEILPLDTRYSKLSP